VSGTEPGSRALIFSRSHSVIGFIVRHRSSGLGKIVRSGQGGIQVHFFQDGSEATASLKGSVDGAGFALTLFPEEDFAKILTRVRQAAAVAAWLKKRLA
jgi:hypothetical protein